MKLIYFVLLILVLANCAPKSGNPTPAGSPPEIVINPPVDEEPPVDDEEPAKEEPPAPVVYTTLNHPLTSQTLTNGVYSVKFNNNGTYVLTDASHITYGYWTPNSNPNTVIETVETITYPMTMSQSGTYQCLPVTGPQTCSNTGFSGNVKVQLNKENLYNSLYIFY